MPVTEPLSTAVLVKEIRKRLGLTQVQFAQVLGVEEWEAEIDDRVAHLYGLTAEEIKIISPE